MNSRQFTIGDITVVVSADLPILDSTYHSKIRKFETPSREKEQIFLHHRFSLPTCSLQAHSKRIYQVLPWEIYQQETKISYEMRVLGQPPILIATFTPDHSQGVINHCSPEFFLNGDCTSLTLFPTDQILLSRVLADRQGCIFHSAGMIMKQQGLLFVGHSGAGKSTMSALIQSAGQILCDDRNIVRKQPEGWRLYGTWSHGDIPEVSPDSAPLRAIILLEQAPETRLIPIEDRREIVRRLPFFIVKPLVTAEWWAKTLDLVGQIAREVPVYQLRFEKNERVIDALSPLLG